MSPWELEKVFTTTDGICDMHTHSNLSNGSESWTYVLENAEKNLVSFLSITDYNTLKGYLEHTQEQIKRYYKGNLVIGVEVNCHVGGGRCTDMLAYNFTSMEQIEKMERWLRENTGKDSTREGQLLQLEFYKKIARDLNLTFDPNLTITDDLFYAGKIMGRELARYEENLKILPGLKNPKNFFVEYCSNPSQPFYFDRSQFMPGLTDFISIVHECGGLVFVAHPAAYCGSESELIDYLDLCRNQGVDGIECMQSYNENITYRTQITIQYCIKHGLFMTAGSDFHVRDGVDTRYSGV